MHNLDERQEEVLERTSSKGLVFTLMGVVILALLGVGAVNFLKVEPDWAQQSSKQQVAVIMDTYDNAEALAYKINSTGVALAEPWDSCDSYETAFVINPNAVKYDVFIIHQNAPRAGGPECIAMVQTAQPRAQLICVFLTRDSRFFRDCPGGKVEHSYLMQLPSFGDILPR